MKLEKNLQDIIKNIQDYKEKLMGKKIKQIMIFKLMILM